MHAYIVKVDYRSGTHVTHVHHSTDDLRVCIDDYITDHETNDSIRRLTIEPNQSQI